MIKKMFLQYGFNLSEKQEKQFQEFLILFKDWNSKINLSSIKEDNEILEKHFIDSVLSTKYFNFNNKKILDLGTGGGFPCIPLSIITNANFVALDSVQKKLKVVESISKNLELNISIIHGRAEDYGQDKDYREKFDYVLSRAVAPWSVLLEICLPFLKIGGSFIAYQGPAIYEDLEKHENLEKKLGGTIKNIFEEKLGESKRVFIEIRKIKNCPNQFPRKAGVPKKDPLK